MSGQITEVKARLPIPSVDGLEPGYWRVLCESTFPNAKSPEAILMALDYCKARKLDPLKKMVHIVPMWSSQLGREVETVWPGIAEVQTTASRTGKYAGMDEPRFGEVITKTFRGRKSNKDVGESEVTITFPEWCAITVYRIVEGQRCAFTEPVYWLEAYGRSGKSELPNDQWAKRPRGMIMKVAKAFSLRAAFPEEADYTKEEMEGRAIEDFETTIEGYALPSEPIEVKSLFKSATARNGWAKSAIDAVNSCQSIDELKVVAGQYKPKADEMIANGNEVDLLAVDEIKRRIEQVKTRLKEESELNQERNYLDEAFNHAIQDYEMPPENSVVGSEAAMVQEGALSRVDSAEPPASKKPDKVAVPVINGLTDWEGWVALLQERELPQLKTKRDAALFRKKYESQIGNLAKADNALFFQLESKLQEVANAAA